MDQQQRALLEQYGMDTKAALLRFNSNEALLIKYLLLFPQDPTFPALQAAIATALPQEAETACHTLKGISGNLGLTPLYAACEALMAQFRAKKGLNDTSVTDAFAALSLAHHDALAMLSRFHLAMDT